MDCAGGGEAGSQGRRGPAGARPMGTDVVPAMVNGMDYLRDPKLFKGMAFSLEERQVPLTNTSQIKKDEEPLNP